MVIAIVSLSVLAVFLVGAVSLLRNEVVEAKRRLDTLCRRIEEQEEKNRRVFETKYNFVGIWFDGLVWHGVDKIIDRIDKKVKIKCEYKELWIDKNTFIPRTLYCPEVMRKIQKSFKKKK